MSAILWCFKIGYPPDGGKITLKVYLSECNDTSLGQSTECKWRTLSNVAIRYYYYLVEMPIWFLGGRRHTEAAPGHYKPGWTDGPVDSENSVKYMAIMSGL